MNKKYSKLLIIIFIGLVVLISGFFIIKTINNKFNIKNNDKHLLDSVFGETITIGKEFDIKLNEIKQTKEGHIKLKVDKIHPDESMGWGMGPYVEITYNINDNKGQYTLYYPVSAVQIGKYRITLVNSDWEKYATMKVEDKYTSTQNCDWIKQDEARQHCYIDVVEYTLDVNDCYKIQNGNIWYECILALAPLAKDLSICDKLNDMPMRYRCYSSVAVAENNLDICEKTKDIPYYKKSDCYNKVGGVRK